MKLYFICFLKILAMFLKIIYKWNNFYKFIWNYKFKMEFISLNSIGFYLSLSLSFDIVTSTCTSAAQQSNTAFKREFLLEIRE